MYVGRNTAEALLDARRGDIRAGSRANNAIALAAVSFARAAKRAESARTVMSTRIMNSSTHVRLCSSRSFFSLESPPSSFRKKDTRPA